MRRFSFTVRAVLLTCVVALLSVAVTAAVAFPLTVRSANKEAREALTEQTAFTAELIRPRLSNKQSSDDLVIAVRLRRKGIEVYVIRNGVADHEGLSENVVRTIAGNRGVPVRRGVVAGRVMLIAGQPLPNHSGVVLVQPPVDVSFAAVMSRRWLALLAGLAAGLIAGPLLARVVSRPIREAARAAKRLSAGERLVRVETR